MMSKEVQPWDLDSYSIVHWLWYSLCIASAPGIECYIICYIQMTSAIFRDRDRIAFVSEVYPESNSRSNDKGLCNCRIIRPWRSSSATKTFCHHLTWFYFIGCSCNVIAVLSDHVAHVLGILCLLLPVVCYNCSQIIFVFQSALNPGNRGEGSWRWGWQMVRVADGEGGWRWG